MKAYRIMTERGPGQWSEAEVPHAGPGEVVLQTAAAGLCRTDLELMDHGAQYSHWIGPFTVGHETAGHVVEVGEQVSSLAVGDAVLVHSNSSCGRCRNCIAGRDAFCLSRPPNYGYADNGGLAPFMKARQRDVLPLGGLDPRLAAPLADAGATAYGALLDVRPHLRDDGYVAVIGVGGVGSIAVQLLRLLTGSQIIAIDRAERLESALAAGAHHGVVSSEATSAEIKDLTRGRGVDATIDIVGADDTLRCAAAITAVLGAISVVGLSGGTFAYRFLSQRVGVRLFTSTTCSLGELARLIAVTERGGLSIRHQTLAFDDVEHGYDALRQGRIDGRAVIDFSLSGSTG